MTCEVAVMNKNGIALAADSAVTLGPQQKVYHGAEKLLRLSDTEPVAIMTFGASEILGVPWDMVIKAYRRRLGTRRFDFIDQYAEDFLLYLESSNPLFPVDAQQEMAREHAADYWRREILASVWEKFGREAAYWPEDAWTAVRESLAKDNDGWQEYADLETLGPGFGAKLVEADESGLLEIEHKLFEGVVVPEDIHQGLRSSVEMLNQRDRFCPVCRTGIVIAGFGEQELFPKVVSFTADAIVGARLRYRKDEAAQVTRSDDAVVMPFAQREMVDLFYTGVYPTIDERMIEVLQSVLREHFPAGTEKAKTEGHAHEGDDDIDGIVGTIMERVKHEAWKSYTRPL